MQISTRPYIITYVISLLVILTPCFTGIMVQAEEPSFLYNEERLTKTIAESDWEAIFSVLAEQDEETTAMEQWKERLTELADQPIPINTATREQLESIPFLTSDQTEALSYYIYRYGPVINISELLLVDRFSEQTLRLLAPFITIGEKAPTSKTSKPLKTILTQGNHEFRIITGNSLQVKHGYKTNGTPGNTYIGDPWSSSVRYGFNYKNQIQWGITSQKDAGELWLRKNRLPDYLSFHGLFRGAGFIRTMILGDFTVSIGQGLACGDNFSLGKSMTIAQPEVYGQTLKRHASTAESGFLRGVALSLNLINKAMVQPDRSRRIKQMTLTAFYSFRHLDATIVDNVFPSISETGLHRTKNEQKAMNELHMCTAGAHLSVQTNKAHIGITLINWIFNAECHPVSQPYNQYYARGNKGATTSINFRFRSLGASWFGEFAVDKEGHLAGIGGINMLPISRINLSILYRHYSTAYNAFFSNAFSEGSTVRNETGCYASLEWRILPHVRLNAYYDLFAFPWMTYQCDEPSSGHETAIQTVVQLSRQAEVQLRYKQKETKKNVLSSIDKNPFGIPFIKNQVRMQYVEKARSWMFQTTLDFNTFENDLKKSHTQGIALTQTMRFNPSLTAVDASIRISIFDTPAYNNRIFSYERSLPGSFSMPSLYGQGARISLCLSFKITQQLSIWLKSGTFIYLDRLQTGTNGEITDGNVVTDVQSLIRWKF